MLNYECEVIFKNGMLHFQRGNKKETGASRQKCCLKNSIRRRITVILSVPSFGQWMWRTQTQISGCDCRQLYQISN